MNSRLERRILVLVIAVLALSFGLAVALLVNIAGDQDRREMARSADLARAAFAERMAQVESTLVDYAAWGAAYDKLHREFDQDWAYVQENVGPTLFTSFGIDHLLLFGPDGREIYSVVDGELSSEPLGGRFGDDLERLIERARGAPENETVAISGYSVLEQDPVLITTAVLSTGGDQSVSYVPGPQTVMVFADRLTPDDLLAMGDKLHVRRLAVLQRTDPVEEASFEVFLAAEGTRPVRIGWSPERPGKQMVQAVLPGLAIAAVALTLALLALLRHGFAAAAAASNASAKLVEAHSRAEHLALHDATTGLPNRLKLKAHLEAQLAANHRTVVLFLDLDRFKPVNDSLGHAAGDAVLKEVALRLQTAVRDGLVARVGGDEFVVVLRWPGDRFLSALCQHLIASISDPISLEAGEVQIGASIGVATSPEDAQNAAELLRLADIALYEAKNGGRGIYKLFSSSMNQRIVDRRRVESELREALRKDEFVLHFQPRLDAKTMEVRAVEALVRWNHPNEGLLAPGLFIGVAEETGLIVPIGALVLERACETAARLSLPVSVNVSPVQFRTEGLVDTVRNAVERSGISPEMLEVEITECVLLEDTGRSKTILSELKAFGVRLAMDDFGTGYSSLSYLRSFPFDVIKIDRQFVADLDGNGDARAIVRAVVGLGHALGMDVVAEGVETAEQLMLLRLDHCKEVQGFYTGRPCAESELTATFQWEEDHLQATGQRRGGLAKAQS